MRHGLKHIIHALILTAAISLSACQIGRKYTRPNIELPAALSDEDNTDSTSMADISWKEVYTDTILQSLISKSLVYNKDMQMAAARIKELAEMKRINYANMFPAFGAKIYAEKEREHHGNSNQFDLKATMSWELDLWGKLRWAHDESIAELMASVENRRALQISLIAQVAQTYYELVALDNELSIVHQTVTARRENELALLTGEYPHRIERSTLPQEVIFPDSLPVGLPSSLLERRPDVREAEQQLIAANAKVGVAYTSMFPNITLTGYLGTESDDLKGVLSTPYHFLSANLLQPIFAMGKNKARHRAAKAAYERATYAYEKAVLTAFKDAYNAIANFNKVKEIYKTRYDLENSSKTALSLALVQYVNGAIGYMDLLDAQRTYLDAQIGLSNALLDSQLAKVNLYKALGGGW